MQHSSLFYVLPDCPQEVRPIKPDCKVNEKITAPKVMLILEDGEKIGVIDTEEAMRRARAAELDLVEVAPEANPPVCRLQDYKKIMYTQKRRAKESRKKTKSVELKECKMRVTIDPHDRATKLRKARQFLEKGDKVKFTFQFRGREVTKPQLGEAIIKAVVEDMKDIGELEQKPSKQDRFIHMIMGRRKDWKPPKTSEEIESEAAEAEVASDN